MTANKPHETVDEILKRKRASIKTVPLDKGAPSWDELLGWTWSEIEVAARAGRPGFGTIRKRLTDSRHRAECRALSAEER